jgi:hypothetical protein
MWPMGVSVHYERGKSLQSAARKSLFGDGMLERARATSLALLGVTAALGLAMVALVFNQNWPLIPGAPIPGFGDRQQAIGDATVAAEARAPRERVATLPGSVGGQGSEASARPAGKRQEGAPAPTASQPPVSESVVVADSISAGSPEGGSGGDTSPAPPPSAQQPVATPAPVAPPTPAPEALPASQPSADSASAPPVQTPVPAAGTPPAELPEEVDDDHPEEGEEGDWGGDHDGGHRGHDHGYGHGHW